MTLGSMVQRGNHPKLLRNQTETQKGDLILVKSVGDGKL
jgi:hypothetical protein